MNKRRLILAMLAVAAMIGFSPPIITAVVSVYPTGTTIYQPDRTWNGYTLLDTADGNGVTLIDMNGNILRRWPELAGMGPFRMFPDGTHSMTRDSSRVLEINPLTFEVVWEYSIGSFTESFQFYSWYVSNAQRLPNGNTMINEGMNGRIFELTEDKELVWEFVSAFFSDDYTPSHRV